MSAAVSKSPAQSLEIGLVLQGGGALGAYQAGVYEALGDSGIQPNWISGMSIGAINAAIFAAEILATSDPELAQRLITYKEDLAKSVAEKSARVKLQYAGKTS